MTEVPLQEHGCSGLASRFPPWLRFHLPKGEHLPETRHHLDDLKLATVCEEARCPNRVECYAKGTATFLALGKECTRACGFCSIAHSTQPAAPEVDEPQRIAESVRRLGLRHAVITMVARDDLPDGGASHLVEIVQAIRTQCPGTTIELLISDLQGDLDAIRAVCAAHPEVFNHNMETVERCSPRVRHRATYRRSLEVLRDARALIPGYVKSGLMVGLGETEEELRIALQDLAQVGCDIVTIGQYLQSSARKLRVKRFWTPEEFEQMAQWGRDLGIPHMYCGPFVRSSYNAALFVEQGNPIGRSAPT